MEICSLKIMYRLDKQLNKNNTNKNYVTDRDKIRALEKFILLLKPQALFQVKQKQKLIGKNQ